MKRHLLIFAFLTLLGLAAVAQPLNPSHWTYTVEQVTAESAELCFTVKLDAGWHIYSTRTDAGGPLPTEFTFTPSGDYSLAGGIKEPAPHEEFDEIFKVTVRDFANQVTFRQKIKRNSHDAFKVEGSLSFQLCNNGSCIAPEDRPFVFEIPAKEPLATTAPATAAPAASIPAADNQGTATANEAAKPECSENSEYSEYSEYSDYSDYSDSSDRSKDSENPESPASPDQQSLWLAFLLAFVAGLLTMITPCVFPMIPMTVNFFVHGGKRNQAWIFGFSIIFIFAVLGALLTLIFGPEALYFLGTHWIPNLIFFIIFLIFSLSFFGLFEIQLPSRWANKSDARADKGGWLAPFFMALTTVLVSFSCTGPILGAALVGLSTSTTNAWISLVTMLGFGIGFALPFTLLALFPQWLKNMKSGNWLNTVKITFAFLELAFGLKFLSMADLYCGWHLLDREVYLSLWIVIFTLLGFYFLGKIRFRGDWKMKHLKVGRLFLAIVDFAFVVYMIPGLFGAPLKAISGFLPPMETQDFNIEKIIYDHSRTIAPSTATLPADRKYADQLHLPTGFDGFFDLDEAKAEARRTGKPIFIDFTGKTCANCREMEHYVWAAPSVKQLLNEQFIICALYADENTITLPEEEWITTDEGRVLKTLGRRNLHLEKTLYNMNAQPYYVIIDADGNTLTSKNYQYDRSVSKFEHWLNEALNNHKK